MCVFHCVSFTVFQHAATRSNRQLHVHAAYQACSQRLNSTALEWRPSAHGGCNQAGQQPAASHCTVSAHYASLGGTTIWQLACTNHATGLEVKLRREKGNCAVGILELWTSQILQYFFQKLTPPMCQQHNCLSLASCSRSSCSVVSKRHNIESVAYTMPHKPS